MKKQHFFILFFGFAIAQHYSLESAAWSYVHETSMYSTTKLINGKEFEHVRSNDNGKVNEKFSINGVPVEEDDYKKSLESAYLADIKNTQQATDRKHHERESFRDEVNAALLEKVIKQSMSEARGLLVDLNNPSLKPYLAFDVKGISSQSQLVEIGKFLDVLNKELSSRVASHHLAGLQEIVKKLEQLNQQLESCLKNSVQQAITQCDDTVVLKELLKMIEA